MKEKTKEELMLSGIVGLIAFASETIYYYVLDSIELIK